MNSTTCRRFRASRDHLAQSRPNPVSAERILKSAQMGAKLTNDLLVLLERAGERASHPDEYRHIGRHGYVAQNVPQKTGHPT